MADESNHSSSSGDQPLSHGDWIAAARAEFEQVQNHVANVAVTRVDEAQSTDSAAGFLAENLPGYELGTEIQRGGQGIVFKGIQRGTRRDVAIKILREGPLASQQGRVRFEREAQILGQLRHPNIVTVLDSGTAAGNYYFIMDFISGLPLDEHIRHNKLGVRDTIALMVKICEAVNVAHLRGIIHRDLKPSNIRVDHAGEPHVMDFGLAKIGEHDVLFDESGDALTLTGQFVGSLPWASPDQVDGRPEKIDLRTDVYAIGVILFQVLTGTFPYEIAGNIRDVLDNIVSAEPPKPSKLNRALDDELDVIILKCLSKLPDLRYQTAGDVASELKRYLRGEPIEAKRSSGWYMLRKSIRRHRVRWGVMALILLTITIIAVGSTYMYIEQKDLTAKERLALENEKAARLEAERTRIRAEQARQEAAQQARILTAVNDFLNEDLLAAARPGALGRDVTMRAAIDTAAEKIATRFADEPDVAAQLHFTLGNTYMALGEYDTAVAEFELAVDLWREIYGPEHELTLHAENDLARNYQNIGRYPESERIFRRAVEIRRRVLPPDHVDLLTSIANLAWTCALQQNFEEAETLCVEALQGYARTLGEEHERTLAAMNNLALIYMQTDRPERALPLLEEDLEVTRAMVGPRHPSTLLSISNLAKCYAALGRLDEAETLLVDCVAARREVLGPDHPSTFKSISGLADVYGRQKRYAKMRDLLQETVQLAGDDTQDPTVLSMISDLGWALDKLGEHDAAQEPHTRAYELVKDLLPAEHPFANLYAARLGANHVHRGEYAAAEPLLVDNYQVLHDVWGPDSPHTQEAIAALVRLYAAQHQPEQEQKWRQLVATDADDAATAAP
jgi:serine/threonine protein kinase/Flp pilus assembly protein TadD